MDRNNEKLTLGMFRNYKGIYAPFFEPSLSIGITFKSNSYLYNRTYIHWRSIHVFSSKDARRALNWHTKHSLSPYEFAKGDQDTFITNRFDGNFLSVTTYNLRPQSNRLQSGTSNFVGYETFSGGVVPPFSSNISVYVGSSQGYYQYHIGFELKYFRGGIEIWVLRSFL